MKPVRTVPIQILALMITVTLAACGGGKAKSSLFPSMDSDQIPHVLEMTVGTVGDRYFATTPDSDYHSYLAVTFDNTTADDYADLTAHYQAASNGTDSEGSLLFSWGRLHTDHTDGSIYIQAWIS